MFCESVFGGWRVCVCVCGGGGGDCTTKLAVWNPHKRQVGLLGRGGGGGMSEAQHRGGNTSSSSTGEKRTADGGAFGPVLIKVQYH
jgi:hypothetical protein